MATALERGLIDGWTADAGLSGLMSDRIFPIELPETNRTFPAAVYQIIDNPRQATQDGDSGTTLARVQVRLYAATYQECCDLRDAMVAFCATHQAPPNTSFGSPAVLLGGWFITNEQDEPAPELKDSGVRLFSKRLDITIHTTDI